MTDRPDDKTLMPCPFCGEAPRMSHKNAGVCGDAIPYFQGMPYSERHTIACRNGHMAHVSRKTKESAISAWNTRTPTEPSADDRAALDRLQKDADRAYCNYIDETDKKCRGLEYKIETKTLSMDDVKAHCAASELLGQHRGITHALKMFRASLTARQPVQPGDIEGWQPIDTAPKDGTKIWTCVAGVQTSLCIGYFCRAKDRTEIDKWVTNVWSEEIGPTRTMIEPTHWMYPLAATTAPPQRGRIAGKGA